MTVTSLKTFFCLPLVGDLVSHLFLVKTFSDTWFKQVLSNIEVMEFGLTDFL